MGAYRLVVNRDSGPEMPLDAAGTERSNTTGPGIPFGPRRMLADVATPVRPSYAASITSRVPLSVAVTDPPPVIVLTVAAVTPSGESRALKIAGASAAIDKPDTSRRSVRDRRSARDRLVNLSLSWFRAGGTDFKSVPLRLLRGRLVNLSLS